ncbi:MAG: tRNA 4-thiouridine(8) synthase ThiI [Proteobacteria bacterium]|nr:tRNA 4-thiouridine(8) synthase ThiI [Pseudomonadota bacterium]
MEFIVIRYAEIALKGGNRKWFEKSLINNLRNHLSFIGKTTVSKIHGRILVRVDADRDRINVVLSNIPGVANFSYAIQSNHSFSQITKASLKLVALALADNQQKEITFKVDARRSYKQFPMNSVKLSGEIGGEILEKFPQLKVKLKSPELTLGVEIWQKEQSIIYLEKIEGLGGLPVGSSGKVISFLSGGIDSPVASWHMLKRGCTTIYLNFHSYPFIGEQSRQKVIDLVTHLSRYQLKSILIIAPFTKIQKAIKENCTEKYRTLLYRRLMYMIGERVGKRYKASAYVTGEAVGQVASQTLKNLACTEAVTTLPVLRPLIGMDKADIIKMAKSIGTYPISIQPFPDCCTVFQPSKPATGADQCALEQEELKFDHLSLINEALENLEVIEMKTSISEKFWK